MRKILILGAIVVALALPAPAFAIHDGQMPFVGNCSDGHGNSQAIGTPATGKANTAFSNTVLNRVIADDFQPPCRFR
jgi:hypothetical protein